MKLLNDFFHLPSPSDSWNMEMVGLFLAFALHYIATLPSLHHVWHRPAFVWEVGVVVVLLLVLWEQY